MPEKLRVVLAGCGSIAGSWLNAVKDRSDIDVVGLVDLNPQAAEGRKTEFALEQAEVGTDVVKALDNLKPDAVFDCTVPEAHYEVTLAALERGCHVLGEKPLADTVEHAQEMVAAAQKAGRIYAVVQNRRYQPEIRALKDFIASGEIGSLTTLNSDFYIGAHFGGFRDRMKHVLILDMAIHTFDAARLISGADPVAVYCHEWNPKGSWYDHDASAIAIFEMSDGIVYNYRGSWCSEGLHTTWESQWRAVCERGSATWNGATDLKAEAVVGPGGFFTDKQMREISVPEDAKHGGHAGVIDEFLQCVKTGGQPETVCHDNIKSLAMVFAAIESAESGRRVEVRV